MTVALTFDDGPKASATPGILDILAERGAPATFFVIGARAEAEPDLVRRALAEGHAVQPHCWDWESHDHQGELSAAALEADLARTLELLDALGCPRPELWRPPTGRITDPASFEAARACGLRVLTWTLQTYDWNDEFSAERILRDVAAGAAADLTLEPDSVVLMHDLEKTVDYLGPLLDLIAERGLALGPLALENRALVTAGEYVGGDRVG